MNKKINTKTMLLALALSAASLNACNEYLDVAPNGPFVLSEAFSTVENAELVVLGAYSHLSGDQGYGIRLSLYFPMDTDELIVSGNLDNGRRGIGRYDASSGNTEIYRPFRELYYGIEKANIAIKYIPEMHQYTSGTAEEQIALKRMHGEALTLRAQYYFELIKNWGDVPFQTEPSVTGQDFLLPKKNRDEIYDHLIADLALAEELVPWRTELPSSERITKGAVKALRAKLALFRGGYALRRESNQMERRSDYLNYYQIAREETWELMQRRDQHTLNPSYEGVFRNINALQRDDQYGEILFEVAHAGSNAQSDSKLGYYNGPNTDPASMYGQGGGGIMSLPNYFYSFDPQDLRRDVNIGYLRIMRDNVENPYTLNDHRDGKFRRYWREPVLPGTSNYLGYNWPLIRFSDVLLMFAEADNEINNGPSAEAIAAFEEVRIRAFGGDRSKIGATPSDKEGFFQAIVKERSLELGGEGIRKYDLIRWNMLGQKLEAARAAISDIRNASGDYSFVPQYMYWRVGSNGRVEWYNSFYEPTPDEASIPSGWNRLNWRQSLNDASVSRVGELFDPNKDELLPIPSAYLATNPNVRNDYGF